MKKIIPIIFILIVSCSSSKISKNHGFRSLDTKYQKISINKTNKNDIINIIGPPSLKSEFNQDIWFYIERKKTNQNLFKLGKRKIEKNNVLLVEFNNLGILINKKIFNIDNMNEVKYSTMITKKNYEQDNFIYNILANLRNKLNSPVKK